MPQNNPKPKIDPISIGLGIAQSGLGYFGNIQQQKHAERMAQEQRQWNLEQWHRQNKYNSPEQQVARLRAAGLNPHLLYGQGVSGATGQASAVDSYKQAESINPVQGVNPFLDYTRAKDEAATNELRAAQRIYTDRQADHRSTLNQLDALELGAYGVATNRLGNVKIQGMPEFRENQIRRQREIELRIAELGLQISEATKDAKIETAKAGAMFAWQKYWSEQDQNRIRQQFLRYGPYSITQQLTAEYMDAGMTYDAARLTAWQTVNLLGKPFDALKTISTLKLGK